MSFLSTLGLTMLFLLAGYELDFSRIRGRPLRRSSIGWLGLVVLGVLLGLALTPSAAAGVMVGICLTSTALKTIMPVVRGRGPARHPVRHGRHGDRRVGEFGPLLAVALFLGGRSPAAESVLLLVFAALIALSLVLAGRPEVTGLHRVIEATLSVARRARGS